MDKEQIWEAFKEIGIAERHFNDLQSKYRLLVSSWLLATFIGIGFIITNIKTFPIEPFSIISLISFFGSIGIVLLWNLDIMVYHRLLDSAFIEGVKLEQKNDWLPQFRTNSLNSQKGKSVLNKVMLFYSGIIITLQVISIISLIISIGIESGWIKYILLIIISIISIISNFLIIKKSINKNINDIINVA